VVSPYRLSVAHTSDGPGWDSAATDRIELIRGFLVGKMTVGVNTLLASIGLMRLLLLRADPAAEPSIQNRWCSPIVSQSPMSRWCV